MLDNKTMHAKPDLRLFLKWMIYRSGSVIVTVIRLIKMSNKTPQTKYDVYDSIVKIGLGALIGVIGSTIVALISNRHSLELQRRTIENSNQQLEQSQLHALSVLKAENSFQLLQAYIDLRRKILTDASKELNIVTSAYADYRTTIFKAARQHGMDAIPDKLMGTLKEKELAFSDAFKRFHDVAGHLKLTGANKSYEQFSKYADTLENFFRACHPHNTELKPDDINEWREKIRNSRESLLDALGEDFEKDSNAENDE